MALHELSNESLWKREAFTRQKWNRIRNVYGLSPDEYAELDRGYCPICLRDWSPDVRPVVDHEHGKESFRRCRGILCRYCNHRIVGRHRDADVLQRVVDYLRSATFDYPVPVKKRKKKSNATRSRKPPMETPIVSTKRVSGKIGTSQRTGRTRKLKGQ